MKMKCSLMPIGVLIVVLGLGACNTPTSPTSTATGYIVTGAFMNDDTGTGLGDMAVVVVMKSGTYEYVADATVTIDGVEATFTFLGYGVSGKTLDPGQTVTVHVVKDSLDITDSVTIPGEYSVTPLSMASGTLGSTPISWSAFSSAPFAIEASIDEADATRADGTEWSSLSSSPGVSGSFPAASGLTITATSDFYVSIEATNVKLLSGAFGSMLVGSNRKVCTVTP